MNATLEVRMGMREISDEKTTCSCNSCGKASWKWWDWTQTVRNEQKCEKHYGRKVYLRNTLPHRVHDIWHSIHTHTPHCDACKCNVEPRTWILDRKCLKGTCARLPRRIEGMETMCQMTNRKTSTGIIPDILLWWWKAISASSQLHIASILDLFWSFLGEKGGSQCFLF